MVISTAWVPTSSAGMATLVSETTCCSAMLSGHTAMTEMSSGTRRPRSMKMAPISVEVIRF